MSRYLHQVRRQKQAHRKSFNRQILEVLTLLMLSAALAFNWSVQHELTANMVVSITMTTILTAAPPLLVSFLIPWTPGGMLLQRINAGTWGFAAVVLCAGFFVYYAFELQWSWWAAQPIVEETDLVWQQVLAGMIGFIVIPALMWSSVSNDDLAEQARQAHLVKRYEMQAKADMAILRNTVQRAERLAMNGLANLTANQQHELAFIIHGIHQGMENHLQAISQDIQWLSGSAELYDFVDGNEDYRGYLDMLAEFLEPIEATYTPVTEQTGMQQEQTHHDRAAGLWQRIMGG